MEPTHTDATPVERAAAAMDESAFWNLIEDTRRAAGNDTAGQSQLLEERLAELSPRSIVEFERMRRRLHKHVHVGHVGRGLRHRGRLLR